MFAAFAAALGFTACNETWDDNPVLNFHEGDQVLNFLNEPEMQNMSVDITEENAGESFILTCSQPKEYGYAASVAYTVEVSIYNDFKAPEGVSTPGSVALSTAYRNCANINPTRREIAEALCKMLDIKEAAQIPTEYKTVYARLHANVVNENGNPVTTTVDQNGEEVTLGTAYTSNTVVLGKAVSCGYLAIIVPGLPTGYYIRGGLNDWLNPAFNDGDPEAIKQLPNYEFVTTTEANTYELDNVEIPEGTKFKFADKNWGDLNLGMGSGDPVYGQKYELGWNTGDIALPSGFKGSITLMGSDKSWSAIFYPFESDTPGQPGEIYLRGGMNGWDTSLEFLTTDVKGIWECPNVTIPAGTEFKVADANWSDINLGAPAGDGKDVISIGVRYQLDLGGGNIKLNDAFTGNVKLSRKGNKYTLTLEPIQ